MPILITQREHKNFKTAKTDVFIIWLPTQVTQTTAYSNCGYQPTIYCN
jgi:hypothetical protein